MKVVDLGAVLLKWSGDDGRSECSGIESATPGGLPSCRGTNRHRLGHSCYRVGVLHWGVPPRPSRGNNRCSSFGGIDRHHRRGAPDGTGKGAELSTRLLRFGDASLPICLLFCGAARGYLVTGSALIPGGEISLPVRVVRSSDEEKRIREHSG